MLQSGTSAAHAAIICGGIGSPPSATHLTVVIVVVVVVSNLCKKHPSQTPGVDPKALGASTRDALSEVRSGRYGEIWGDRCRGEMGRYGEIAPQRGAQRWRGGERHRAPDGGGGGDVRGGGAGEGGVHRPPHLRCGEIRGDMGR